MPEVAHAGEHHRDAVFIGGRDDFVIALAAARLDHCANAVLGGDVEPVAEREERVRSHHAAGNRQLFVGRLHRRDATRIDAAHLARTNADGGARATIGVGAGQMSRVYSSRVAAMKAADEKLTVAGSVMASDAFFPFRDGLDVAAEYGIRAVIQPGGSKRDDEVIAAANEHGIAMVFTGMRHFRH